MSVVVFWLGQSLAREVIWVLLRFRKDEARGINATRPSLPAQIVSRCRIGHQPNDAAWDCIEQTHPDVEQFRIELVAAMKRAEYKTILGQPTLCARPRDRGDEALAIVHLEAVREKDDLLGEVLDRACVNHEIVSDYIIDEWRTHTAGITEIADLDWRWASSESE